MGSPGPPPVAGEKAQETRDPGGDHLWSSRVFLSLLTESRGKKGTIHPSPYRSLEERGGG